VPISALGRAEGDRRGSRGRQCRLCCWCCRWWKAGTRWPQQPSHVHGLLHLPLIPSCSFPNGVLQHVSTVIWFEGRSSIYCNCLYMAVTALAAYVWLKPLIPLVWR
jgi:hypothetical protein